MKPIDVSCQTCGAVKGSPCVGVGAAVAKGRPMVSVHVARARTASCVACRGTGARWLNNGITEGEPGSGLIECECRLRPRRLERDGV